MIFESGMHFDFEKAKAGFPGACFPWHSLETWQPAWLTDRGCQSLSSCRRNLSSFVPLSCGSLPTNQGRSQL